MNEKSNHYGIFRQNLCGICLCPAVIKPCHRLMLLPPKFGRLLRGHVLSVIRGKYLISQSAKSDVLNVFGHFNRFTTIPFSSNLGQSWKATRLTPTASETLVSRYERLCVAKPIQVWSAPFTGELTGQANPLAISNRFRPVVFKRKEEWSHSYSFSRADRRERMKTIATGKHCF